MGHPYNPGGAARDLDIEESRRLVPHQNATTMQVAISVVAASMWMIENPQRGRVRARRPAARLRPGRQQAVPGPVRVRALGLDAAEALLQRLPRLQPSRRLDPSDPWQFKNFLITEGDGIVDEKTSRRAPRRRELPWLQSAPPAREIRSTLQPEYITYGPEETRSIGQEARHAARRRGHKVLRENYAQFRKYLPRVQVYYAVKANSAREIIRTFYEAGASFDVASWAEFLAVHEQMKDLPDEAAPEFHLGSHHLRESHQGHRDTRAAGSL